MKKKVLAICLVVALLAISVVGVSLAYFTDSAEKENVFTMGNVDINLEEADWTAPEDAIPGVAYDKDPHIDNVGDNAAWVRMQVTISDYTVLKAAADKYGVTLLSMFNDLTGDQWAISTEEPVIDDANDSITYTFYYEDLLDVGESTSDLFTSVTISPQFTQEDLANLQTNDNGDNMFSVVVAADAIQEADSFATVYDAFAAFDA